MPQRGLGQGAHIHAVGAGERGEPGVPGGTLLGGATCGLGAERIALVVDAVQLAVGANRAGPLLPVQPIGGVLGHRAEGAQRPLGLGLHGVLADPCCSFVHRLGEPVHILLPLLVGNLGHPLAPGAGRERHQRSVIARNRASSTLATPNSRVSAGSMYAATTAAIAPRWPRIRIVSSARHLPSDSVTAIRAHRLRT
jgi:hypothetical protein